MSNYQRMGLQDGDIFNASHVTHLEDGIIQGATFVTPEMFGAVGDSLADDSDAIQAAINYGGLIVCAKTYRITKVIHLRNPEVSGDTGAFRRSHIIGKQGLINQLDSGAILDYLQPNQATFIFDGGYFRVQYTCQTTFTNCVFMGKKDTLKTQTAFYAPEVPFRRLEIYNSTFVNFDYAIRTVDTGVGWSGEHVFSHLYFSMCNYCIYMDGGGYDSIFEDMIAQVNCGYFLYLTGANNALITTNHDYTSKGSHIYGSANITGNYFDGINKLHIKGGVGNNNGSMGPTITGNTFLIAQTTTGTKCLFIVETRLVGATITGNVVVGGDSASIVMFNVENCTHFYWNTVKNNSGKIGFMFSPSASPTMTANGNNLSNYAYVYCGSTNNKVYEDFYPSDWGGIIVGKYNTPTYFTIRGTGMDGIYCPHHFVEIIVTLTDDTVEERRAYAGYDLSNWCKGTHAWSEIASVEYKVYIRYGQSSPNTVFPLARSGAVDPYPT